MISGINGFDSKLVEMSSQVPISVLPVLASSFTRTDIWKLLNKSFQRRVRDGVTCKERKFVIRGLSYQDFHASGQTSKCVLKHENNKRIQFFMSYCWVIIIGLYFKLSIQPWWHIYTRSMTSLSFVTFLFCTDRLHPPTKAQSQITNPLIFSNARMTASR